MGIVDETLKVLDRIPIWKRLGEVPDEIDDMKKRVAALEKMLGGKWPADVCKACGARALRMQSSMIGRQHWLCAECKKMEIRTV